MPPGLGDSEQGQDLMGNQICSHLKALSWKNTMLFLSTWAVIQPEGADGPGSRPGTIWQQDSIRVHAFNWNSMDLEGLGPLWLAQ